MDDQSEQQNPTQQDRRIYQELFEWMESCVWAVISIVLIFTFVGRTAMVVGDSMIPTLHDKDSLIMSRLFYSPMPQDIVVVAREEQHKEPVIKRIIAVEGQTIDIDFAKGIVSVDGVVLDEPYINGKTHLKYDMVFPAVVPKDHVFAMGDNRNNSLDSRDSSIGMIDQNKIMGKAYFRMYPFDRIGVIH